MHISTLALCSMIAVSHGWQLEVQDGFVDGRELRDLARFLLSATPSLAGRAQVYRANVAMEESPALDPDLIKAMETIQSVNVPMGERIKTRDELSSAYGLEKIKSAYPAIKQSSAAVPGPFTLEQKQYQWASRLKAQAKIPMSSRKLRQATGRVFNRAKGDNLSGLTTALRIALPHEAAEENLELELAACKSAADVAAAIEKCMNSGGRKESSTAKSADKLLKGMEKAAKDGKPMPKAKVAAFGGDKGKSGRIVARTHDNGNAR